MAFRYLRRTPKKDEIDYSILSKINIDGKTVYDIANHLFQNELKIRKNSDQELEDLWEVCKKIALKFYMEQI